MLNPRFSQLLSEWLYNGTTAGLTYRGLESKPLFFMLKKKALKRLIVWCDLLDMNIFRSEKTWMDSCLIDLKAND